MVERVLITCVLIQWQEASGSGSRRDTYSSRGRGSSCSPPETLRLHGEPQTLWLLSSTAASAAINPVSQQQLKKWRLSCFGLLTYGFKVTVYRERLQSNSGQGWDCFCWVFKCQVLPTNKIKISLTVQIKRDSGPDPVVYKKKSHLSFFE